MERTISKNKRYRDEHKYSSFLSRGVSTYKKGTLHVRLIKKSRVKKNNDMKWKCQLSENSK